MKDRIRKELNIHLTNLKIDKAGYELKLEAMPVFRDVYQDKIKRLEERIKILEEELDNA